MNGTLYILSTPIGNLKDITLRALEVLKLVDLVAAEDTRHTKKLLDHFEIQKELFSYYEDVEQAKLPVLISHLQQGKNVALVSDAGTPLISDPGFRLVREAAALGILIVPIPGPNAALSALSVSGLPTDRFEFFGFLPEKPGKRKKLLESLAVSDHTLVFYVSPYKFVKTIGEMLGIFGDRSCCLARELTKMHEEIWRGPLSTLLVKWTSQVPKGEITLVIAGASS